MRAITRRGFLAAAIPGAVAVMPLSTSPAFGAEGEGPVMVASATGTPTVDTANVAYAIAESKRRADRVVDLGEGRLKYIGLPEIQLGAGEYVLTESILLRYVHGLRIRGQGRWATRIVWAGAGYLFEIERSRAIEISGLRVSGRAEAPAGPNGELQGLREDSGFCRVIERKGDGVGGVGGNTLMLTFADLELEELHRGWSFEGDQMTDGASFERLRLRDVFEGWAYRNSMALNHTYRHVEFVWALDLAASAYAARLDTWKSRPHVRDGAAVVVQSGGKATMVGCSFITVGPTFRIEDPPQDGSQLAITNILPWTLLGCSWEIRQVDTVGDANGLQRTAVILPKTPYPAVGNAASQSRFTFYGCDWYTMNSAQVLFYLRNDHRIRIRDSRVTYRGVTATGHRMHCLVNARSASRPGAYLADGSTKLLITSSTNDATSGNPHRVRQANTEWS
jgi:hypothetical protein